MQIEPSSVDALFSLVLGFAFAGLLASAFELLVGRPLAFGLLQVGGLPALASVPFLVFSAPHIIMRTIVRGPRRSARSFLPVMMATIAACLWSLLSGRLVLDAAQLLTGA